MDVTFTKLSGRRYAMRVVRERGPELAPRHGPGYDDHVPHDVVHFLVEAEAGLTGGAFGRIAAGRNNIFWPLDPAERRRQARREAKRSPTAAEHAEMARSERLASLCQGLFELRAGRRTELPPVLDLGLVAAESDGPGSPMVERVLTRMGEFAERWHALPPDGSITLTWPPGPRNAVGRDATESPSRPRSPRPRERRMTAGRRRSAHSGSRR